MAKNDVSSLLSVTRILQHIYEIKNIVFAKACRELSKALGTTLSNARRYLEKIRELAMQRIMKLTAELDLPALRLQLAIAVLRNAKLKNVSLPRAPPFVRSIAPLMPRGVAITLYLPRVGDVPRELVGEGLYIVEYKLKNRFELWRYIKEVLSKPEYFVTTESLEKILSEYLDRVDSTIETKGYGGSISYELLLFLSQYENNPLPKMSEVVSFFMKEMRAGGASVDESNARRLAIHVSNQCSSFVKGLRILYIGRLRELTDVSVLFVISGRDSRIVKLGKALVMHPLVGAVGISLSTSYLMVNAFWRLDRLPQLVNYVNELATSVGAELCDVIVSKRGAGARFGIPCIAFKEVIPSSGAWLPPDSTRLLRSVIESVLDYR